MAARTDLNARSNGGSARRAGLLHPSTVVGAAIGVGILALLIWRVDAPRTWATMLSVKPLLLVAALLLNVPLVLARALRAQAVLRVLGHHVPYGRMLLIQLVGQTLSSMTPAASGDLVRAYLWRRHDQVPGTRGVTAVAFERIYSFLLLSSIGFALALAFVLGPLGAVAGLAITLVAAASPWLVGRLPEGTELRLLRRAEKWPLIGRFAVKVELALAAARQLVTGGPFLIGFAALTLTMFVINGGQLWLLLIGLGAHLQLWTAIGVFALAQTGGTVSTLPFALGTMEIFMAGLLVRGGLAIGRAASAALLLRAVTTLPLAVLAILAYLLLLERGDERAGQAPGVHELA